MIKKPKVKMGTDKGLTPNKSQRRPGATPPSPPKKTNYRTQGR